MTWVLLFPVRATWNAGRTKGYCCSMQRVRAHQAGSHQNKGWETFTDAVIRKIAEKKEHLVFLLWGSYAQRKGAFIDTDRHLVLKCVHPSPLSANRGGWFGNHQFSRTNQYLREHGLKEIEW